MIENILQKAYLEHTGKVTDKWSLYLQEYDRLFSEVREQPVRFLEIGIQNGGSLEIWADYFGRAERIVGCDINPKCHQLAFDDARIAVVIGDVNNDITEQDVLGCSTVYDIIIDDGSHRSSDIIKTFSRYFKHLADGGLYVIEDLHCSYWQEFEGGLFAPYSSITFFKKLVDIINHEHWGVRRSTSDFLSEISKNYNVTFDELITQLIHSIEFINSMCVIRKLGFRSNRLGHRIVVGHLSQVDKEMVDNNLHQAESCSPDQSSNFWSNRLKSPEEELVNHLDQIEQCLEKDVYINTLRSDVTQYEVQIEKLKQSISTSEEIIVSNNAKIEQLNLLLEEKDKMISNVYSSISWCVTSPFRWVAMRARLARDVIRQLFKF